MKRLFYITVLASWCMLSHAQPSAKTDIATSVEAYGTPFKGLPDRRDVILYQVNMRVFGKDGNFRNVIDRLDSIRSLGANVVYLMPIYPVGQVRAVNSPYCIKDYDAINSEFGDLRDLRELVDKAHEKKLAVILDWVANHTAYDHPWTNNKSWYLQDSTGNIVSPPGMGWNDVAQLNFKNQDMRREMIRSMKDWVLKANIDGFRCDYSDGPPADFWKQVLDTLNAMPGRNLLMLAEGSRSTNFTVGFDYNFGFNFFGTLKSVYEKGKPATAIESVTAADYAMASPSQRMVRYTSNHDVNGSDGTPEELFGGERGAMGAFVVAAYMKGIPMIYNGQEVGTPYRLLFPFTSAKIDWKLNPERTNEYRRILAFYKSSDAVRRGDMKNFSTNDVCAFEKKIGREQVLVLVNVRNSPVDFNVAQGLKGKWSDVFSQKKVQIKNNVSLQPYSYIVLKRDIK